MVNRREPPKVIELVEFGNIEIPANLIVQKLQVQNAPAIRQGPEGQRSDQQGMVKMKFSDFTGGLFKRVGDWTRDGNRYQYNEGLMTHIPGGLYLPYVLTTQTSVTAVDISGYRALNKRVHSINSSIGAAGLRFYAGIGTATYSDTSLTDPTLDTHVGFTNNITSMAELVKNNTPYLCAGTDGDTDDVVGWADPVGASGVVVKIITLSSGDAVYGMATLPQFGKNVYYGKIGGVTGLFFDNYTDAIGTAPRQVVSAIGANTPNPNNAAESVTEAPTVVSIDSSAGFDTWTNPDNIKTSNDAYAAAVANAGTGDSYYLVAQSFGFNIPTGAIIQGIVVSIEGKGTGGSGTFPKPYAKLWLGAAAIGDQKTGSVFTGSDTTQTLGGANDNWGYRTGFEASDINDPSFGVRIHVDDFSGGVPGDANIDYVTIQVYYLPPGLGGVGGSGGSSGGLGLPLGGYSVGLLPSNKDRWVLVCPVADDATSTSKPRQLVFVNFAYEENGDRLTAEISYPHTGLHYVESACFFAGGIAVAGDRSSTVGKTVKILDSNNIVRDLGYLGQDGYETAVGVSSMFGAGRVLIVDSSNEDGTDSQWWYYFDGTWHASTPLQTKSSTIGGIPLGWAESVTNVEQQYRYRIFPRSAAIACAREFQPRNLFEDPIINNTTIVKQDDLYLTTPEMNLGGPEEAQKSLVGLDYLGRLLSPITSTYGTLDIAITTHKADTVSVPLEHTFDTDFEAVDLIGRAFTTASVKFTLTHTASSTKTGNGVPILLTMSVTWPPLYTYEVYFDWDELNGRHSHITNFLAAIDTLIATRPVQALTWGAVDVLAVYDGMDARILPSPFGSPSYELTGKPFLIFRQVRGSASATK